MIYLATPYSHKEKQVMNERFNKASEINARLLRQGLIVYSPIAHCHPLAMKYVLPTDWKFWQRFNEDLIARSNELLVVKMDGWETSTGVQAEIKFADANKIPVRYIELP